MSEQRIARLERRLQRERSSREQAERIAEDGMRRLFIANQELDARVADRTKELDEERLAAAQSAAERAEFLRLLSREARSPLNGVIGMMEVLNANAESEQAQAWASDGLASATKLQEIMTRLLLFLELEEEQETVMAAADPNDVISAIGSRWKHEALRAGMLLTTENRCADGAGFYGHIIDVEAILDEVVSNAVKHGQPGLLEVSSVYETDGGEGSGYVVFSVTDSGPGIEDVAPLLDPSFHDFENSQARGMGYSLVKRLADRTAAVLEIESAVGSSTSVKVKLPSVALGL